MITQQFPIDFRKDGTVNDPGQVNALLNGVSGASDLLVLVHGWNNDKISANATYDLLLRSYSALPQPGSGPGSNIVVLRAFWPSRAFSLGDLIPGGGAASAGSADSANDAPLLAALDGLRTDPVLLGDETPPDPARSANIDQAVAVIGQLESSETARREFVLRIRAVLNPEEASDDDASREFFELEPEALFAGFTDEVEVDPPAGGGGAADLGDAAAGFLGDLFSGPKAAARRIANYATYYQMKTRAGTVGRTGLAGVVARVRDRAPQLPVHLAGHSFGGRTVTAAASALAPGGAPVTMSLLQAAFSHNGLAHDFDGTHDGAFRTVLGDHRISGPVIITCTKNDLAVGVAYPLASRIAHDVAAGLGDRNDPYGGMGRNGAQHTPEISADEAELRSSGAYKFAAGRVYNLNADRTIHSHMDVTSPAVANAVQHLILGA